MSTYFTIQNFDKDPVVSINDQSLGHGRIYELKFQITHIIFQFFFCIPGRTETRLRYPKGNVKYEHHNIPITYWLLQFTLLY